MCTSVAPVSRADGGVVEGRGACAKHPDLAALEPREVDIVQEWNTRPPPCPRCRDRARGMPARAPHPSRRARPPAPLAARRSSRAPARPGQLDAHAVGGRVEPRHLVLFSTGDADRFAHPKQVSQPVFRRDLVKPLPSLGAVLRLIPSAKCQRGKSEVGPRQVLGRAQGVHARIGAPWALAPVRGAIDDAHVTHPVAHQGKSRRLPTDTGADDEYVEHRPAVWPWGRGHPVGRWKFMRANCRCASATSSTSPEGII